MPKKWDIVLVPFPFTDLSGSKVRPAVIISNSSNTDDILVIFISSSEKKPKKFDVLVKLSSQNGLKVHSVIKCSKIATLERKVILGQLGQLEKQYQKIVTKKLKEVLGL